MLEQSVKLSRLIIFYFISNFLIYTPILPNREPKTSAFRIVLVFKAVLQLLYSCFSCKIKCAANANHCGFQLETGPEWIQILYHLDGAFEWLPIRMSRLLLFSALNYLFFSTVLPKNCISLIANHNRKIFSCILWINLLNTLWFP